MLSPRHLPGYSVENLCGPVATVRSETARIGMVPFIPGCKGQPNNQAITLETSTPTSTPSHVAPKSLARSAPHPGQQIIKVVSVLSVIAHPHRIIQSGRDLPAFSTVERQLGPQVSTASGVSPTESIFKTGPAVGESASTPIRIRLTANWLPSGAAGPHPALARGWEEICSIRSIGRRARSMISWLNSTRGLRSRHAIVKFLQRVHLHEFAFVAAAVLDRARE